MSSKGGSSPSLGSDDAHVKAFTDKGAGISFTQRLGATGDRENGNCTTCRIVKNRSSPLA